VSPAEEPCPHCGGDLQFLEKDTFSGREYREYRCLKCGELVTVGGGVALWQRLHDANEQGDKQRVRSSKRKRWWSIRRRNRD
jgi:DNA-directed RNA polymerase subunit RPC12/RpoP